MNKGSFKLFLLLLLCVRVGSLTAQFPGEGQSLEAFLFAGRLVKHSPQILFDIKEPSYGALLTWQLQTDGSKPWHLQHRLPRIGVSFIFYDLGEKELLGEALGIWPHISLYLWRKEKFELSTTMGSGLGYLNRSYHPLDNPVNNAIGSPWNYLVNIHFDAAWQAHPNLHLLAGFSLTHFSNGASRLPNLGINLLAGQLGLRYTPSPVNNKQKNKYERPEYQGKRWGMNTHLAMGFREYLSIGGPQYPIYLASLAATYRLNVAHKLLAGLEYEYNSGAYAFGRHIGAFDSEREARWRSSRLMAFLADEILFGDWSLLLQLGAYLNKDAILRPSFLYTKIGTRYYLPAVGNPPTRFYAGFYLKAHSSVAEYVSLGFGAQL